MHNTPSVPPLCSTSLSAKTTILDDIYRPGAPWLDFSYLAKGQRFELVKILHALSPDLIEQGVGMLRLVDCNEAWDLYLGATAAEALHASGEAVNGESLSKVITSQFSTLQLSELRPTLVDRVLRIRNHSPNDYAKVNRRCLSILWQPLPAVKATAELCTA